jgi:hypothetical protein
MSDCSMTRSKEAENWPEGTISVKLTMNPYLLAMAVEKALESGISLWEYVNAGLWEKLGKPSSCELTQFAASLEVDEDDPKWKKRLKVTARYESEVKKCRDFIMDESNRPVACSDGNGDK